jgi:hypothetical protein
MIDNIFDKIIEFGKQQVELRAESRPYMSAESFAKEHATVGLNTGRQSGKTTSIARRATPNDIVICSRPRSVEHMLSRITYWTPRTIECQSVSGIRYDNKTYDVVWIDDASMLKQVEIDKIYELYAHRARLFVMVG